MAQRSPPSFAAQDPSSPLSVPPTQTALILGDFQTLIISMLGDSGKATVPIAVALRQWARTHNITVIHSLIDVTVPAPPSSRAASRLNPIVEMAKTQPNIGDETPELAFPDDVILKRPAGKISALYSTGIREVLESKQIKSVIVCGLATSGVVLSTVRSMYDDGYIVTVAQDACADRTEETHRVVMNSVLSTTAHVADAETVMKEFDKGWPS